MFDPTIFLYEFDNLHKELKECYEFYGYENNNVHNWFARLCFLSNKINGYVIDEEEKADKSIERFGEIINETIKKRMDYIGNDYLEKIYDEIKNKSEIENIYLSL
jgi:hypothetical protein